MEIVFASLKPLMLVLWKIAFGLTELNPAIHVLSPVGRPDISTRPSPRTNAAAPRMKIMLSISWLLTDHHGGLVNLQEEEGHPSFL